MPEPRHLTRAPITEAVISLRTKLPSTVGVDELSAVRRYLGEGYSLQEEPVTTEFLLSEPGAVAAASSAGRNVQGFTFRSVDGFNVAQFRLNGFTFSRLHPYETWESLLSEARRLWNVYAEIAQPEQITRLGVRYINHILLPLPVNLGEFFTATPTLASGWPEAVVSFLSRIALVDETSRLHAVVTQTSESSVEPHTLTIILDIECFAQRELQVGSDEIWELFGELRALKNRIFFNGVTERTLERFA